jgi:hypothetical protein
MTPHDYDAASSEWQRAQAEAEQDDAMDEMLRNLADSTKDVTPDDYATQRFPDDELEDAHFEDEDGD